ncbi:sulfatase-like hydrolase/transferase [Prosthecobacter sp.]|uniref:sulfatase-like hydrolase/transferase n=1 Tax=Prosthecobacter sp. TaxID=1965333 RepID=UPI001D246342|nr:sulfatase-like hydrolase/transferase [Prosthecobacter sp.]MCB1278652.1 sulfatase-like hydrolase/transferase [Prosthecobacter sp.]
MRLLTALCLLFVSSFSVAADRPNIVWIVSEDNSIHYLKHFFPGGAETPAIEAMAAHGLTFDNAFSNAPVCSVARTTLATMCYGPRIGTQFHRRYKSPPLPDGVRMFPEYLRKAGYYTTNNSKTDYNAEAGKEVWDESSNKASWRNRPDAKQPFFHMQSHAQSHESSLHFNEQTYKNVKTKHDPAKVQPGAHLPDTPLFRYTHALYLDKQQVIDDIVAQTVADLQKDGLLEDTFIFYFGDHGGVLPRGKGYVYDTGLHVPLVIRVPEHFKNLVEGADLGARVPGFVQFIDFGATALQLAGVPLPHGIDGRAFLGKGVPIKDVNERDEAFGYANRMDEKYDFVRTLRKGKYQYIRSFEPWLPDGLHNNYRYKMLAYEEWRQLWKDGKFSGAPAQFFERKPVEMLFDCEADPWTVKNLATDPAHAATLQDLRGRLQQQMRSMPDLSYYPESYLAAHAMDNPVAFGQKHLDEIRQLADIADLMLRPFAEARLGIEAALKSDVPMQRYWGAMVCTAFGKDAAPLTDLVRPLLNDPSEIVRVRALEFLGSLDVMNPQPALTDIVNKTADPVLAVEALNSVVWFKDHFAGKYSVKRSDFHPLVKGGDVDDRLNYINGVPYPPNAGAKKKKGKK